LITFAGLAGTAHADIWISDVELMMDRSAVDCTNITTEPWQLSLSGSTLSGGYIAGGTLFTTEIAADGSVDATFSLPITSTLEKLTGNAARREFFLTNTKYACVWKLVPKTKTAPTAL
jgi:hypothetical protein